MSRPALLLLMVATLLIIAAYTAPAYPNPCPTGIYSGDRVVIAAWDYDEEHVWGFGDWRWVEVSVPAKSNTLSGLGGDYHLVSNFVCFRYGVEGYATYKDFDSKRPSLSVSYTPDDTNYLESISASASSGYIKFRVVSSGSASDGHQYPTP